MSTAGGFVVVGVLVALALVAINLWRERRVAHHVGPHRPRMPQLAGHDEVSLEVGPGRAVPLCLHVLERLDAPPTFVDRTSDGGARIQALANGVSEAVRYIVVQLEVTPAGAGSRVQVQTWPAFGIVDRGSSKLVAVAVASALRELEA